MLAAITLLTGVFLVFSSQMFAVARRRQEFAFLRALEMTRTVIPPLTLGLQSARRAVQQARVMNGPEFAQEMARRYCEVGQGDRRSVAASRRPVFSDLLATQFL